RQSARPQYPRQARGFRPHGSGDRGLPEGGAGEMTACSSVQLFATLPVVENSGATRTLRRTCACPNQPPPMNTPNIARRPALPRRTFLKAIGATVTLPLLEAMTPSFVRGAEAPKLPRRMLAIQTNQGILPQFFFPEQPGTDYTLSPYLEKLAAFRKK